MELTRFIRSPGTCRYTCILLVCLLAPFMILPAVGADATIQAELGDTINLHGVSYTGSSVYLFMTGPGLPENGVTLTDVTQRADQGKFTQVDLDSNQAWSYRWNTARIENEINAGTYLVYVTNAPVDKSHLGGSGSYQTLEVYLIKSTTSRVSISSGTSYTLNPREHPSSQVVTTSPVIATAPLFTTAPFPEPSSAVIPNQTETVTQTPAKKTSLPVMTGIIAVICSGFVLISQRRKKEDQ
jgi:hypothetical protein